MTPDELDELIRHNAEQMAELDPQMAARVAGLLRELRKPGRDTHLRLREPAQDGARVEFELVEGSHELVAEAAQALGFERWTDGVLEMMPR